jgi:predicted flavoprotein YhiN
LVKDGVIADKPIKQLNHQDISVLSDYLHAWQIKPNGTEGYRTAEVTLGGVNTDELSSKTFESKKQPGLFFIGEVIDVTGWLGGFNFQFCWASGYACGQAVR